MTQQAAPEAVAKSGQRLTTQEYWEKYWNPVSTARMNPIESRPVRDGIARRTKLAIRAWCITRYFLRNYSDYVVWEKIYPKHLPSMAGANVLEVGCAPGDFLIRLQRTFGCVPYGVEYTSAGVELTRAAFLRNGLDPEKVIFADAFSHDFQSRFQSFFDGVVSRGVIEHFAEVKPIVGKHLALLKPGGWLALTIPNYRGCNYVLKRVFAPKSLAAHNLHIMRKQEFRNTCGIADLQESFCSYYGTCDLSMCVPEEGSKLRPAFEFFDKAQLLLNAAFRLILRGRLFDWGLTSPFLMFIGFRTGGNRAASQGVSTSKLSRFPRM